MRKAYNKPFIMVELFQLNAALASACSSEGKYPLNYSLDSCSESEGLGAGYWSNGCTHDVTIPDGDGNDGICYHAALSAIYMNS